MNTQNCLIQQCECSERKFRDLLKSNAKKLIAAFRRRKEHATQRRQLREMDDHMLKDIGLSRADVARIAGRRWFWEDQLNRVEDLDQRYRSSDH